MAVAKTLVSVFVIVVLAVLIPRLAWTIFETFGLAEPDSKFGPWGGIQFVAFFVGIAAAVAGFVATVFTAISLARNSDQRRPYFLVALISGLILCAASFLIPRLPVYDWQFSILGEISAMVLNWAALCAVVLILVYAAVRVALPPNNRSHADAREGARAGEAGR